MLVPLDVLFSALPWKAYASNFGITVPHNELLSDLVLENLPWKDFARQVVSNGALPLWNPNIFAGEPFLAAGQAGVLYPLGVIFFILPPIGAYGWFSAVHFLLAGVFMYMFLRVLGANRTGALVSGLAYSFSSLMVVSVIWPMVLGTIVWLPLLLLLIELIIRKAEAGNGRSGGDYLPLAAAAGAVLGISLLSGHLEYSFYVLFTLLFYSVARLAVYARRGGSVAGAGPAVMALAGIAILGVMLASAQLLPFFELARENFRSGLVSYQDVIGFALPKQQALSFVMPDVFGNPTHNGYFDFLTWQNLSVTGAKDLAGQSRAYPFWGIKNYVEAASYIGVLPLLLAVACLLMRRSRYTVTFAALAVFSLLLAFGTPLYGVFWSLPGFDQLHTPFRWLFPYTFSVAVLAGLGASALTQGGNDSKWGRIALAAGTGAGGLILLALAAGRFFWQPAVAVAQRMLASSQALAAAFSSPEMLFSYEYRNLLVLGLLLVGGGFILALRPHSRKGRAFLVLLAAADLFYFGYQYNAAQDPKIMDFVPPSVQFLQQDKDLFRVVSFNYEDSLTPNTAELFGIQDARGYDSIILREYADYWKLMEEPHGLLYNRIYKLVRPQSLTSPFLDLLNVKYVLTNQPITDAGASQHLKEVYRGEVIIYENLDYLPRAFLVAEALSVSSRQDALASMAQPGFDPRKTVVLETDGQLSPFPGSATPAPALTTVSTYSANEVVVETTSSQGGYLVLADNYFSGWRASLDGQPAPIYRADGTFRAVSIPGGPHQVVFKYSPDSFNLGLLATFFGLFCVAAATGTWGWRRLKRRLGTATPIQRLAKNASVPIVVQVGNRLLDFAFAIYMLRLIGLENAGKYAFVVVLIGYFVVLTDFGLTTLTTREVAKSKEQANHYLSNTTVLRLIITMLSLPIFAGILGLYAWRFGLTPDTGWTGVLLLAGLFPAGVASALSSVFMAHERMEITAAVALTSNVLKLVLGVGVLVAGLGIVGLGFVSLVVNAATAVIFYYLFRRTFFKPLLEVDLRFQWRMVRTAYPLMINIFLSSIFFKIDVMLLTPMQGDKATGLYTTAYKFIDGLVIIPSLFTLAVFPILARYADSGGGALLRAYTLSLRALLLLAMPITVGVALLADHIVVLFFGLDYAKAGAALSILVWFLPFSFINSLTQYVLIAVNQQRFLTRAFIIGAVFNVLANLALIPRFGYNGAAYTTVVSEIVLLLPFMYAVWRHVGAVPFLRISWRPVLASGVMGMVVWWLRPLNMAAPVAAGALVYVAALLALKTFNREDRALVQGLLGRKDRSQA
ncbi:MAG: oligosaccharide flippase family protein [Dehalococcoidia bacterium]|nr:oligosaccharide flippase family protein [Dehalococcoidia bacterium]